jgi:ubiquinone/menaquinone biosynthesis C-methylase UbiE
VKLSGTDSFKSRDAASYDDKADNFDRHTDRYSTYAVDAILHHINRQDTGPIVDIGCGTGVVTLAVAKASAAARVVGLDLSGGMLTVARAKAAATSESARIDFVAGDAEALALADDDAAQVVSLYAWRHFPNPARAAAEVFRILKPGGRFVVAVGSAPPLTSAAGLAAALKRPARIFAQATGRERSACDHIDALVEQVLPPTGGGEAAGWTHQHHGFSGSIQTLVCEAGFTIEATEWHGRDYSVTSADDFWDLQTTFSSVARKRIGDATSADRARLRAAFDADCASVLAKGGRLVYRVGAALVVARKPERAG